MSLKKLYTFIFCLFFVQFSQSQSDTLVFSSGNKLIGEIKKMEKGVLEMDVSYGKENFKIKWIDIEKIFTSKKFLINVDHKLFRGKIAFISDEKVTIINEDEVLVTCLLKDILYISEINEDLKSRFSAALEFGFNLAKTNNTHQLSIRSSVGYKTDKSALELSYNILRTKQDDIEPVKRIDGLINFRRILVDRWYVISSVSVLSNTEQKIDIRANTQLGIGNYIYATNKGYWGLKSGLNNNLEKFSNNENSLSSWEAYLGTELNLYDMEDLNLTLVFMNYSSFTDKGRYRADLNFDIKYDLPLNLFVRTGLSWNFDNKPTSGASNSDYILRTGIGWEL